MAVKDTENVIVYQARLHWILFLGPVGLVIFAWFMDYYCHAPVQIGWTVGGLAVIWEFMVWLTYQFSFLNIMKNRIVMCSGILVRQTLDIPMNKIESVDIRQSILGSILQYGSLVITGTGGTRQSINFIDKPLTCRRYIENIMYDTV